MHIQIVISI